MTMITLDKDRIKGALLDETLRATLPGKFLGFRFAGGKLQIDFAQKLTDEEAQLIAAQVQAHNPDALTPEEQTEKDQAALLDQLRKPWTDWTTEDKDLFLQILAAKAGLPVI